MIKITITIGITTTGAIMMIIMVIPTIRMIIKSFNKINRMLRKDILGELKRLIRYTD